MMIRLWLLAALATLSSCATYNAGFSGRALPGGYTLLAVPVFKNMTPETGTEVDFTNAMIRELGRSKVATITEKSDAQATLEGTILTINYVPSGQLSSSDPRSGLPNNTLLNKSYRVSVLTRITLRRNSDQAVLWSNSFALERVYDAPLLGREGLSSVNALYNHSARYQTLAMIANDMMAEAHDRLTENFW